MIAKLQLDSDTFLYILKKAAYMANLLKEIGRRVSLYDIVEQSTETDKILSNLDNDPKKYALRFEYLSRHACRAMLRMTGNLEIALGAYFGYTAASIDPEQVPKSVILAAGGVLTYLADYVIFDKINPLPTNKKKS